MNWKVRVYIRRALIGLALGVAIVGIGLALGYDLETVPSIVIVGGMTLLGMARFTPTLEPPSRDELGKADD